MTSNPEGEYQEAQASEYLSGISQKLGLDDFLRYWAKTTPHRLAISDSSSRAQYDFGSSLSFDFHHANQIVDKLASIFLAQGLSPGDLIAIQHPNTAELPLLILGAWRAQMTVAIMPYLWRGHELNRVFETLPIRAIISAGTSGGFHHIDTMYHLAADYISIRFLYSLDDKIPDGVISLKEVFTETKDIKIQAKPSLPPLPNRLNSPAMVSWARTEGGKWSPFYRTHGELIEAGSIYSRALLLSSDDRILNSFLLSNLTGFACMFSGWTLSGSALFQHHPFDYRDFVADLFEQKISYLSAPPALLEALAKGNIFEHETLALSRVGLVLKSPHLQNIDIDALDIPVPVFNIHNFNEISLIIKPHIKHQSLRHLPLGPITGTTYGDAQKVILETRLRGNIQSATSNFPVLSGTLLLRGPLVPKDAHLALQNRPPGAAPHQPNGWVHTGIDAIIADSSMDMIQCKTNPDMIYYGGEIVEAGELDALYTAYPDFTDAAVFTLPDPMIGQKLFALIVPMPGTKPVKDEFDAYLHARSIAPFKVPEKLIVIDEIPRDDEGAILRQDIAEKVKHLL